MINNQNATKHGFYSIQAPPDQETINLTIRRAIEDRNPKLLRAIARALRYQARHGNHYHQTPEQLRKLAQLIHGQRTTQRIDAALDAAAQRLIASHEQEPIP